MPFTASAAIVPEEVFVLSVKRAYGYPGDGAVAVFRARKEFGGDDRVAVDERLTRIPLLDPVEHVGIDPVLARDTRLGFRPDERQAVNRPRNGNGNIQRTVLGKGCRSGGNRIGHCFPAVIHRNGRETGWLDNRSDGKILVFRITARDLDGRSQANGREHLPRMVCGKDVFPRAIG